MRSHSKSNLLPINGEKMIAISRLLYDVGSPGMAFKLSESAICDAIEQLSNGFEAFLT
jgi:hypothetical protein